MLHWYTDLESLIPDNTSYVPTGNFPFQRDNPFATSFLMNHLFACFKGWLAFPLPGKYEHCLQIDNYARLYINHQMIYKFKPDIVKHCVEYYSHPETNVGKKYLKLDMVDWGILQV